VKFAGKQLKRPGEISGLELYEPSIFDGLKKKYARRFCCLRWHGTLWMHN